MADRVPHQARGLIRTDNPPPNSAVRVIAVASGKGGVGKTSVSVNLALGLCMAGEKVLLLDADLGMANVDVLLGLQPTFNLLHVIEGRCTLQDALLQGPMGLTVIPAASGQKRMAELEHNEHIGVIRAFSSLEQPLDTLVIDSAAGISDSVITFARAAQEVVVVACNEPASLTDAYALMKVLSRDHGVARAHVISNMVRSPAEGYDVYDHLKRVAERFLDIRVSYLGHVPQDEYLRRAVQRQRAVLEAFPGAPSSIAFRDIASRVRGWTPPAGARGDMEFFVERLVGAGVVA